MYYFNPIKYNFPTNVLPTDASFFMLKPTHSGTLRNPPTPTPPERVRDVRVMFTAKSCLIRKGLGRSSVEKKGATFPVFRWFENKVKWMGKYGGPVCIEISWIIYSIQPIHVPFLVGPYLVFLHRFFPGQKILVSPWPKKKMQTPKFQLTIDPPNQTLEIIDVG